MTSELKKYASYLLIGIVGICIIALSSCNEEQFSSDPTYRLEFSNDTLSFDTIFTTQGSATSKIMVYNRNNKGLKISNIGIRGGKISAFRINVDGSLNENNQFEDIEIRANDSLYIFVAVTINPQNSTSPQLTEDALLFTTNGVKQSIQLQAYGQDMEVLKSRRILNDTTLSATKPYIIYDSLVLTQSKTLTLAPGCKLYFHNNAKLIIYGNLKAEGTLTNPIVMRGDRLDKIKFATPFPYNYVAGQWGGIYLRWNKANHILKNVNMNSGYVGIYLSNKDRDNLPNLEITNCRIHNFLLYGLWIENGNVNVTNTEISNSSSYCVYLSGGKHSFVQSTIANHFNNSNIQPASRDRNSAVMINNMDRVAAMETIFRNCIISGSAENEFSLITRFENIYNGTVKNCYIHNSKTLNLAQFANNRWYAKNDTVFKSISYDEKSKNYFNFTPDSISPARGLADKTIAAQYPLDLNGNSRMQDGAPDAGAYEWKSTK